MPQFSIQQKKALENCDLLIIMGSSLLVSPANQLPEICLEKNIPVAIINIGETKFDDSVDLRIDAPAGETATKLLEALVDGSTS